MKKKLTVIGLIIVFGFSALIFFIFYQFFASINRTKKLVEFLRSPEDYEEWVIPALLGCGNAPFVMPSKGYIGFLWGDSFRPSHQHQGIDIFSGEGVGQVPVFAAFEGYLTRLLEWKSTVIIRIPSDPLQPDRQIWTYYTHLADSNGKSLVVDAFPPGTSEAFVSAGTLLGYQGNFSGKPGSPTGIHLHFSIVQDDGEGIFLNELEIGNTLDPSPYFGMSLNGKENHDKIPTCLNP